MKQAAVISAMAMWTLTGIGAMPAAADTGGQLRYGAVSDYVWRGIALTRQDIAFQVDAKYTGPQGFYAGTFLSTVDQAVYPAAGDADVRGDFFGGIHVNTVSGLGWNLGLSAVRFDEGRLGFEEAYLSINFGRLLARAAHDWDHDNTYLELGAEWDLGSGLLFNLHGGNFSGDTVDNYNDYGAGFTTRAAGWDLGLAITTTDIRPKNEATRTHTVLSVKRSW